MNKRKVPILSIVLYVVAGLLLFYTSWGVFHSHKYISEMIKQNQIVVRENVYDITNFYMSNSAQYVLFAVIIFTLGWILQKNDSGRKGKFDSGKATPSKYL
jgi:hypothetical protein